MVSIDNLSVSYDGEKLIQFPNWSLEQGAQSLILGSSGSGKTTLLHLLGGLLKPKSGKLIIAETDTVQLKATQLDHFRGKNIGLIFQKPHLINSLSILDNMYMAQYFAGLPKDKKRVEEVLEELNIAHKIKASTYSLSQGEAQRVSIARAMLNQPKVILADEPTSALDDDNCFAVLKLIQDKAKQYNATLVMATHDQRVKDRIPLQLKLEKG